MSWYLRCRLRRPVEGAGTGARRRRDGRSVAGWASADSRCPPGLRTAGPPGAGDTVELATLRRAGRGRHSCASVLPERSRSALTAPGCPSGAAAPWAGGGRLPTLPCKASPLGGVQNSHVPHRLFKARCDFGVSWNFKNTSRDTLIHSSMFPGACPEPGPGRGWVPVRPSSL